MLIILIVEQRFRIKANTTINEIQPYVIGNNGTCVRSCTCAPKLSHDSQIFKNNINFSLKIIRVFSPRCRLPPDGERLQIITQKPTPVYSTHKFQLYTIVMQLKIKNITQNLHPLQVKLI